MYIVTLRNYDFFEEDTLLFYHSRTKALKRAYDEFFVIAEPDDDWYTEGFRKEIWEDLSEVNENNPVDLDCVRIEVLKTED